METDEKEVLEIQQNKHEQTILHLKSYKLHVSFWLRGLEACQLSQIMRFCLMVDSFLSLAHFSPISTRGANPADVAASPAHSAHVTW